MTRSGQAMLLVAVACAASPRGVGAQSRAAIVSLQYESPTLVVPIAVVSLRSDEGREWTLGVVGWTLGADWRSGRNPHEPAAFYAGERYQLLVIALTTGRATRTRASTATHPSGSPSTGLRSSSATAGISSPRRESL